MVECGGLENRFARNPGNEGSNPSSSASIKHEVGKRISDLFSLLVPLMVPQTVPLSAPHLEKFKLFVDGTFSGTRNGTFSAQASESCDKVVWPGIDTCALDVSHETSRAHYMHPATPSGALSASGDLIESQLQAVL